MKSTKQTDIAVFFGGKPRTASQSTPKASPEKQQPTGEEAAGAQAPAEGKLKRLRKAGTPPAAPAAAADVNDLEDTDVVPVKKQKTPTEKGGSKKKTSVDIDMEDDEQVSAGIRKAEQTALEEEDDIEVDLGDDEISGSSESEAEEEAGPAKKSDKKKKRSAPLKSPVAKAAKVDGVGNLAIKQAAEHGNYDVSKLATWKPGEPVPFSFLANTFEAIAEESKRLVITSLLLNAFRTVIATTPEDLLPMVYLCTNRVAPAHEGLEMGIGDATLIKVGFWFGLKKSFFTACS